MGLYFSRRSPWNDPLQIIECKCKHQADLFFVCLFQGKLIGTAIAGYDGVRGWVNKVAAIRTLAIKV